MQTLHWEKGYWTLDKCAPLSPGSGATWPASLSPVGIYEAKKYACDFMRKGSSISEAKMCLLFLRMLI